MDKRLRKDITRYSSILGGLLFVEGLSNFIPSIPPLVKMGAGALIIWLVDRIDKSK